MKEELLISFLLRVGLAIVFLYAAIASFMEPNSWIGFLPAFAREILPTNVLLWLFSIYEILLALWLLSAKRTYLAALFATGTMLLIIIFNMGALDVIFRDVAILFMAIALAIMSKESRTNP